MLYKLTGIYFDIEGESGWSRAAWCI